MIPTSDSQPKSSLFTHQRQGAGPLAGIAALLAAWIAIAAVMCSAYLTPPTREPERCQVVCRQTPVEHVKG